MARNPRDDDVMSNDSSSEVNSDVSSSYEHIKFDDGIDQRDTNHTSCAVSQSDVTVSRIHSSTEWLVPVMVQLALRLYPR